jgi:hypothetical protein
MDEQNLIIYNTADGKVKVALIAKDGQVWMNQNRLSELFATSTQNISLHITNILKDKELNKDSVIKEYLITAADGKEYNVMFYSLDMILAIGFRVRSKRGVQFRIWANQHLKEFMIKGVSPKIRWQNYFLYAHNNDNLNRKNGISTTPLN